MLCKYKTNLNRQKKKNKFNKKNKLKKNIIIYKGRCPYLICHAKRQNDVFNSTRPPTPENVRCCKTSYIGTIGNSTTAKKLPTIPQQLYLKKIENIRIKNNKIFQLISHMALQAVPLIGTTEPSNSVGRSSVGMRNFSSALDTL